MAKNRSSEESRKEILEAVIELSDGDTPPTLSEFDEQGPLSSSTVYKYFDSWDDVIKEAGFDQDLSEDIIEGIQNLADGDIPPTVAEYEKHGPTSSYIVSNYFRSWNEAVKKAGYNPNQRTEISAAEITKAIRELADGDTPPTSDEYSERGPTSLKMVYDTFDSWADAVAEAGFEPQERHGIPREKIIESVQNIAEELGRPPRASEFADQGITSPYVAKKRCDGTWKSVIEESGYDYNKNRIPKEDLLEEIHRLAEEHDRVPTQRDIKAGKFSVHSYQNQWGKYNNAVKEAGYEPRKSDMTRAEVLDRLQELASELGRTPRVEEVNNSHRISERPVLDKFGTWWAGLVRAGLRPQKPRPLCPEAFLKLHQEAVAERNSNPMWALTTLLFQFTGLTREMLAKMSEDWIKVIADDYVISIPQEYVRTDYRWEFKLPETWHSKQDNKERPTRLPELLVWYFESHDSLFNKPRTAHNLLYRIASQADLDEFREVYEERHGVENAPRVRPVDLRVTHGLQLARNGAPPELIEERLGLDAVGSYIEVQELFIWLDEREDFQHPEFQPSRM